MIDILIVEDVDYFARGLIEDLIFMGFDSDHITVAKSLTDTMNLLNHTDLHFDLGIIDLSIPRVTGEKGVERDYYGIDIIRELKKCSPSIGIVVPTAYPEYLTPVYQMMIEGTYGIIGLSKESSIAEYRQAIERVLRGETSIYHSPHIKPPLAQHDIFLSVIASTQPQMAKHIQVLAPILNTIPTYLIPVAQRMPLPDKDIADQLGLAINTIGTYKQRINQHVYDTIESNKLNISAINHTLIFLTMIYLNKY